MRISIDREPHLFGILHSDIQGKILDANDTFLNMLGYAPEDYQAGKMGWNALTPPEYQLIDDNALQQLKEHGFFQPYEKQFIRKDNSRVDVLLEGVVLGDSPDRMVMFAMDITEKKRLERALKNEKLFRLMAEYSTILIWFLNQEQHLTYVNRAALDYLGVTFEELSETGWGKYVYPDDLEHAYNLYETLREKKAYYENVLRLRRHDGVYRWFLSSGGPLVDESGEVIGSVGSSIDIHDRKMAEASLSHYSHRLEQSNKDLEHFATIASHDLQEPLRKVMFFSDHLQKSEQQNLSAEGLDDLKRMQLAINRMQRLINDLLDLSRVTRRDQTFQKINLAEIFKEAITELSYTYPDIRNQAHLNGELSIDADRNQMYQMATQLLDNAFKFQNKEITPVVNISIKADGNQCKITVTDNGIGMKEEHLPKIFDTFVRLHHGTEYPGTGIGLSLVRKIVERHEGSISADSTPGKGSSFVITLPASQTKQD